MLKNLILYPFLFIVYLLSYLLVFNLEQVDPVHVIRPLLVLLLASGLLMLLFYKLFQDWHYAGYLVFLALVFFFAFGYVNRELQELFSSDHDLMTLVLLVVWLGILVVLGFKKLWLWFGGAERITPLLNLTLVLALILQGFSSIKKYQVQSALPGRSDRIQGFLLIILQPSPVQLVRIFITLSWMVMVERTY